MQLQLLATATAINLKRPMAAQDDHLAAPIESRTAGWPMGRRRIGELSVDQDIAPVNRVRRTSSSLSVTCR